MVQLSADKHERVDLTDDREDKQRDVVLFSFSPHLFHLSANRLREGK